MPKSLSSYALYILITVLIVCLYLGNFTGLNKLQWFLGDLMYSFRGEEPNSPDMVLVGIDDTSCDALGNWPWSYDILADLVATCNSGEPRAILMNIDLSPRVSEDTVGHTEILANQVSWVDRIILTYDIALAEYAQHRMSKPRYLHKSSISTDTELGILKNEGVLNIRRPFLPSDIITQYADGMGFTYLEFDKDRKVRWIPLVANYDGYCYPSATLLSAAGYLGYGPDDIVVNSGRSISIGRHTVPTDEAGRMFVNYGDPHSSFTRYSAVDLIKERVDLTNLKDKMILIGVTGSKAQEAYNTPVTNRMSLTEIMGNVIENIAHDNYINRLNLSGGLNLLILLGFGAFCAAFLPRVTLLYRMVILFICLFILVNLNFILFNSYNILTNSLYLGLEIVLFMLASPLLDDSNRPGGQFGFFNSLTSRLRKDESQPESKKLPPSVPIREVRDTGQEQYFQETEHIESVVNPPPPVDRPAEKIIGAPSETVAMDSTPPPPPSISSEPPEVETSKPPEAEPSAPVSEQEEELPEIMPQEKANSQVEEKPAGVDMTASPHSGSSPDVDRLTSLGRYQVIEELGKGAMGTVFKGVDPAINRPVALKTIRLDFVNDQAEMEELRDRLAREARAAGKLSHPNIVTIYDIGSENNLHYIAMEYLEGQTLESLIKRKVKFSYKIIANIVAQICLGLQYAHEQGIVHRDIKPANIMVLPDYSVKVMDFGIARVDSSSMTRTGIAMGTPNYIAPELLQGKSVDRRCDIFSLGVVIYELITGRRPFKGENLTSLIYSIINDDPKQPSSINENIPLIFDHITSKALQKNPVERFQKASDLMGALSDFVGSFGGSKKVGL
jgi:serine/threonine-protein kinase